MDISKKETSIKMVSKTSILFLLLGTVPLWIKNVGLYEYIGVEIVIWSIYAMGFNILLGYTGLPSFSHGAFFGIGAYAMAIYQLRFSGNNLFIGLFWSILIAVIASSIVGCFISHRRGIYFALMTIAFGQIFWFISMKLHWLTGGEDGLLDLKRLPVDFGFASIKIQSNVSLYYFVLFVLFLVIVITWKLIHSPFGTIIQAIKQNEKRVRCIGYNNRTYKWISYMISGGIAGLAGGLFALAQQSSYPDVMNLQRSGVILMMTIIGGGLVSYWGPIIGAVFFILAQDIIGSITPSWMLWYGLLFVVIIAFKPEGIAGILNDYVKKFKAIYLKKIKHKAKSNIG